MKVRRSGGFSLSLQSTELLSIVTFFSLYWKKGMLFAKILWWCEENKKIRKVNLKAHVHSDTFMTLKSCYVNRKNFMSIPRSYLPFILLEIYFYFQSRHKKRLKNHENRNFMKKVNENFEQLKDIKKVFWCSIMSHHFSRL